MPAETAQSSHGETHAARVLEAVLGILRTVSGMRPEQLDRATSFLDLGFDSLLLVQVAQAIESSFGVKVSIIQLLEETSSAELLANHLAQQVSPGQWSGAKPSSPPVTSTSPISDTLRAPSSTASTPAGAAMERLVAQQLELMRQQIDALRSLGGQAPSIGSPPVSTPAAPVACSLSAARGASTPVAPSAAPFIPPFQPLQVEAKGGVTPAQKAYLERFVDAFAKRTGQSKRLTQSSRGVLADARCTTGFKLLWKEMVYPIVASTTHGSRMVDVDGNRYVDITMGFGVHLFGHSPPFLIEAMQRQMEKSLSLGPQTALAGEVAAELTAMSGTDRAVFCNSGTEALMGLVRAARTLTRRNRLVMFSGSYHGCADVTLSRPGPAGELPRGIAVAPGVDPQAVEGTVVLEYGAEASLEVIESMAGELAAVLVEPVQSRQPWVQPSEFLKKLREITRRAKVLLVFDETITGFRSHGTGAQEFFGVKPDAVMYGKHLGGGLPIGILCGSRELMDVFDGGGWGYGDASYPAGEKTLFTGTYFKHPLTLAASLAVLKRLKEQPEEIDALNRRTASMVEAINAVCETKKAPFRLSNFGSLFKLRWQADPPLKALFFYQLIHRGIYYPIETNNCFLSTAHTDEDVERIRAAFTESLEVMFENGFFFETGHAAAPAGPVEIGKTAPALLAQPATSSTVAEKPKSSLNLDSDRSKTAEAKPNRSVGFSLYFFGDYPADYAADKYRLLLDAVRYADREGFEAVWLPERHFHPFGGFSPNPAVLAAALAGMTQQIHLRAGSVVLPLHHPLRAAEDWALADNLSGGRVGVSFATGWHPNDFAFAPENYEARHRVTEERITTVRSLWRGESVEVVGGAGNRMKVRLHPQPKQKEIPLWISGVSPQAFQAAGRLGAGILTNLQIITLEELAERVKLYREARAAAGFDPDTGRVTVLLHAFLAETVESAQEQARKPFLQYVKSSLEISSLKVVSEGGSLDVNKVSDQEMNYLLSSGYERYLRQNRVLIGTVESCQPIIDQLIEAGATEVGCLLDFGIPIPAALRSLERINELRRRFAGSSESRTSNRGADASLSQSAHGASSFPLTDGQRALFLISQLSEEAHRTYQEAVGVRLHGQLQLPALRQSVQRIVDRHEALRTVFTSEADAQVVLPTVVMEVPLLDLSTGNSSDQERRLIEAIHASERELMDLHRGPLIAVKLFKLGAEDHLLVVTIHHLVADGHSYGMFFRELRDFYNAAVRSESIQMEAPAQYRDYVTWLNEKASSLEAARCRRFWLDQLSGDLPVLELPTDRPRPANRTYRGARLQAVMPATLVKDLRKLGAKQGSTLLSVMLAGYQLWLHRLSGQRDVVVALPAMGEALSPSNDIFGYRINVLPIRSRIPDEPSFSNYVKQIRNSVLEAMGNQHLFVGSLVGQLGLKRDPSRSLLFSTLFNLDRATSMPEWEGIRLEEFSLVSRNPSDTARFDLSVNLLERHTGDVLVELDFNTDLFDRSTMERWLASWRVLLESAIAEPDQSVWALPMVPSDQRRRMLEDWNATLQPAPSSLLLHELFERQVGLTPQAIAVEFEQQRLTYRQLDEEANRLAHLLRHEGVKQDRLVAVCCERSLAMVVSILAVLKAGGAYVPIDPEYPASRIAFMLQDANASLVLMHQATREKWDAASATLICLDRDASRIKSQPATKPVVSLSPDALAYVIYTSGSTGQPKGVMIPHGAITNHMHWMQRVYPVTPADAVFQKTPFSFDASVWEFYAPLLNGARLVMASPGGHRDPSYLVGQIEASRITVLQVVPSLLRLLLDEPDVRKCGGLKRLFCGGEPLTFELVRRCAEVFPTTTVHNLYGPTEATIDATAWDCSAADERSMVPIGRPVDNTRCYVVDPRGALLPIGVIGELMIAGDGLARGYWNRPDLTQERFLPDSFNGRAGERMYRTGDLCRYRSDGVLEFRGRADHQVKHNGFRIELEEIERVLEEHPDVKECVVVLRSAGSSDRNILAAYLVLKAGGDESATLDVIKAHARSRLAESMVPASLTVLSALPRTPNGKLERASLPVPSMQLPDRRSAARPPSTALETLLLDVWSLVLERSGLGVDDNIFDLGGDSILIARISVEAKRRGISVPPKLVYLHQTVSGLAGAVEVETQAARHRESELRNRVAALSPDEVRALLAKKRKTE